jgi:hypothetical protein
MIPNPRVQRGKRFHERLLNGFPSRPEDESPASAILPTPQAALMADLLRPGWFPLPTSGITARPQRATDGTGHSPTRFQPCPLLTQRLPLHRSAASLLLLASPRLSSCRTALSNIQSCFQLPVFHKESDARNGSGTNVSGLPVRDCSLVGCSRYPAPTNHLLWRAFCREFCRFKAVPQPLDRHKDVCAALGLNRHVPAPAPADPDIDRTFDRWTLSITPEKWEYSTP